jgi:hypothetical protein
MNDQVKNFIARFGQAFTDEDAAFNFPIKYPAIDLDKPTKEALYKTAGIISIGLITMGFIIAYGNRPKPRNARK